MFGSNAARMVSDEFEVYATYNTHPSQIRQCQFLHMDIRDNQQVNSIIKDIRPALIIHAAGLANVDYCETVPDEARVINTDGTENIAIASKEAGAKLIYISTDSVFDGERGMYMEEDTPHPLSVYSITKLEGESKVQQWAPDSIIVRTAFYGWNLHDKSSLAEWVINGLRDGKTLRMWTDTFFSPILVNDLIDMMIAMYRKNLSGVYHVGGSQRCSKYEFGQEVARTFGLDPSHIETSSRTDAQLIAPRPKDLSLNITKVSRSLDIGPPNVKEGLDRFKALENLFQKETGSKDVLSSDETDPIIPYGHQSIDEDDIAAVVNALKMDRITQGPQVEEFERAIAEYCQVEYAVAVNSGTSALHIACLASGMGYEDEAITTPITFVASANSAVYCGAKPVFADIDKQSYNISPEEIERKITARTRMIIPVHFAGQSCDMQSMRDIVSEAERKYNHKIFILEDACHALGALYKGEKVGGCTFSDMVAMSFHPIKHITTGEGGIVLTNDAELHHKLKLLRSHGITSNPQEFTNLTLAFGTSEPNSSRMANPWYYEQVCLGYNYRITDIQCALGLSQLKKLESFRARRSEIVNRYNEAFGDIKHVQIPVESIDGESNFHLYVLLIEFERIGIDRDQFMIDLQSRGIQTQVHYIPVHLQPFYKNSFGTTQGDCPNAEQYYQKCLSIPLYPAMTDSQVSKVVMEIRSAVEGAL